MKVEIKIKLATIHILMDADDKSTEYMIQFMQDCLNLDHDAVMSYLISKDIDHYKNLAHAVIKAIDAIDNSGYYKLNP